MALDPHKNTLEQQKYRGDSPDDVRVAVNILAPLTKDGDGNDCVAVCGEVAAAPSVGGLVTRVTISSSVWTPLPATNLADRVGLAIQNQSNRSIRVNYSLTEPAGDGMIIPVDGERFYDFDDNITIYARLPSGGDQDIMIEELA